MIESWDDSGRCNCCYKPLGDSAGTIYGIDLDDESENRRYAFCRACTNLYNQRIYEASEIVLKSMVKRRKKSEEGRAEAGADGRDEGERNL